MILVNPENRKQTIEYFKGLDLKDFVLPLSDDLIEFVKEIKAGKVN